MARIRSLKPELWTSSDFQALTTLGRLAFIALISQADDEGRLKTDAKHLSRVYLDGARVQDVSKQLETMRKRSMIATFTVGGESFIALNNWSAHQKIDRPTPSRIPKPPFRPVVVADDSSSARRVFDEDSSSAREDSSSARHSRARGSIDLSKDLSDNPPTPRVVKATSTGGEEKNPKRGSWTHDELHQRAVDLLAWWAGISGHLDALGPKQATLTQERAMEFATLAAPLEVITQGLAESYAFAEEKPQFLYAPTLWRAAGQAEADWLKQRPQKRTAGLEPIGRSLAAVAVGHGVETDPDD